MSKEYTILLKYRQSDNGGVTRRALYVFAGRYG